MAGKRERSRAETTARILEVAREQVAEHGAGMSMRAVAREVGMVSSAVYRYFSTREALLTAMISESYGNAATALGRVRLPADPSGRWRALAVALRRWATAHRHEFQLIYGTPIPGYVAPPETVPAAAAVAAPFLEVGAQRPVGVFAEVGLSDGMTSELDGLASSGVAAVLAELTALVGFVNLELAGHLVGTVTSADALFEALIDRQISTLGLPATP